MSFIEKIKEAVRLSREMGMEVRYAVVNDAGLVEILIELESRYGTSYEVSFDDGALLQVLDFLNEASEEMGLEIIYHPDQMDRFGLFNNIQEMIKTILRSKIEGYMLGESSGFGK